MLRHTPEITPTRERPLSTPHPEYQPEFFDRIARILAKREQIESTIPTLKDSPLLTICQAIYDHYLEDKGQTVMDALHAKAQFHTVWEHYKQVVKPDSHPNALKFIHDGLKFFEKIGVKSQKKISGFFDFMLEKEHADARRNETYNQNGIARTGGVHEELLLVPNPDRTRDPHEHIESLQIAAAQQFVQYLLNQKDYAGYSHDPIPLPDAGYAERTRTTARQILEFLRDTDNGWEQFASPSLAAELKKHIIIPADLDAKLNYGTHDYNLVRDDQGREHFVDPQITISQSVGKDAKVKIDASHFLMQVFSTSGEKYKLTSLKEFLSTPTMNIYKDAHDATQAGWIPFPKLRELNTSPQTHLAVSFSVPATEDGWEGRKKIYVHRANHGRIYTHIHQDITDRKHPDYIHFFPGHMRKDGKANNADGNNVASALGVTERIRVEDGIIINPFFPDTDPRTDRLAALFESALGLSDVEFIFSFDDTELDNYLNIINDRMVKPVSDALEKIFESDPEVYEIIRMLNPKLSRHTLLGLLMEKYGPTANCVFLTQAYERLGFSIFPKESDTIDHFASDDYRFEAGSERNTQDLETIGDAIHIALVDQAMTYLGFSPLGALGIYASGEFAGIQLQGLAKFVAMLQAPKTKEKTDILFQISELGRKGLLSLFVSANSRFNGRTTNAISLQGDNAVFRLNLNDRATRQALGIDAKDIHALLRDQEALEKYKAGLPAVAQKVLQDRVNKLMLLAKNLSLYYPESKNTEAQSPAQPA